MVVVVPMAVLVSMIVVVATGRVVRVWVGS
jgi:hypothetical protein